MTYNVSGFEGCCAAMIVYDVSNINKNNIKYLNKEYNNNILYTIVDVMGQNVPLEKFLSRGWKKIGRSFVNPSSGNRLQTLVKYPTMTRKQYLKENSEEE